MKGGAQLIALMCTCSEYFASPSKNAISSLLQSLASIKMQRKVLKYGGTKPGEQEVTPSKLCCDSLVIHPD